MKEILSSLILIAMGSYGIILYFSNKLSLYIHPRFFEESLIASIFALIIGIICFTYFLLTSKNNTASFKKIFGKRIIVILVLIILSFLINSLFLLIAGALVFVKDKNFNNLIKNDFFINFLVIGIVALALSLPPKGLSSITASQRSIDLNSINLTQNTISAVQNFSKSTTNYSLGDWIAMQGFNPDPLYYKDKDVRISGFIYKPENLNLTENTVLIARFIITCCAVDARPVGIKVLLPKNLDLKVDDWVEVTGKFDIDDTNSIYIKTDNVNKIEEPNNPYIF